MHTEGFYRNLASRSSPRILIVTGIIAFLALLNSMTLQSQSCCPNGISFWSQTGIDNFQANYPGCIEIEGDVYIVNNYSPKITNLQGLNVVTSIGGGLVFDGMDKLTSFSGLENLEHIGGRLEIMGLDSLTDITALNKLEAIGGLWVEYNRLLTNLSGLDNITHIEGGLSIYDNDKLQNVSALSNVTSIEGELRIVLNQSLSSLVGLENVTSIGGNLFVVYNYSLCSLTGLDNIDAASVQGLQIYGNDCLSECEVLSICNYLNNPNGDLIIEENALGCNSIDEVLDSCDANSVSVEEQNVTTRISVYPNPTSSEITISGVEGIIDEINIYNKLGQRVIHKEKDGKTIDVSWLPKGLYIIEVVWDGHRVREKLIVQ